MFLNTVCVLSVLTSATATMFNIQNGCRVFDLERGKIGMDCSNNRMCNVTRIPSPEEHLYQEVLILNMSSCNALVLTPDSFAKFTNLEVLDLYNTSLKHGNVTFAGLHKLKYLNISQNDQFPVTNKTPDRLFRNLSSLIELRMFGTTGTFHEEAYPEHILRLLSSLKELWMDARNIPFGEQFANLPNLQVFRISGDMIEPPWRSLEFCEMVQLKNDTLKSLVHVQKLYVNKCGIKSISGSAFKSMTKLKYVDLSFNSELTIERAFEGLKSLHENVTEIVLNNVENIYHMDCGVTFKKRYAENISHVKVTRMSMEKNAIKNIELKAFLELPQTIEHLNMRLNEFEIGWYLFYAYKLQNLKVADFSFNSFADDFGLWRKYDKTKLVKSPDLLLQRLSNNTFINVHNETNGRHEHRKQRTNTAHLTAKFEDKQEENDFRPESFGSNTDILHAYDSFVNSQRRLVQYENEIKGDMIKTDMKCPKSRFALPPKTITAYLPPNLTNVDLSFSKLGFPISEFFFDDQNNVRNIMLSGSLLYCWEGPIHGLKKLEVLDLSLNDCSQVSKFFFSKFTNLKVLNLTRNLLNAVMFRDLNGELFRANKKLTHLYLSFNFIHFLPENFLINQRNLEYLDFSENSLRSFELTIDHMKKLTMVDLRENHIFSLNKKMQDDFTTLSMNRSKKKPLCVDLRSNPIECSCKTLEFLHWLYKNSGSTGKLRVVIDHCFEDGMPHKKIALARPNDLENTIITLERRCASFTGVIVATIVLIVIVLNIIVGVVVHRFRWKIRYWYYVANPPVKRETRGEYVSVDSIDMGKKRYMFDVYVASVTEDTDFVLETLKPKLESKYRLFLQESDILPGQNMYSTIANAIHVSRVAIFVVSQNCESDQDWQIAIRFAQEETCKRNYRMYMGIFRDVKRRKHWSSNIREIRRDTYVDFPNSGNDRVTSAFWQEFENMINEIRSVS